MLMWFVVEPVSFGVFCFFSLCHQFACDEDMSDRQQAHWNVCCCVTITVVLFSCLSDSAFTFAFLLSPIIVIGFSRQVKVYAHVIKCARFAFFPHCVVMIPTYTWMDGHFIGLIDRAFLSTCICIWHTFLFHSLDFDLSIFCVSMKEIKCVFFFTVTKFFIFFYSFHKTLKWLNISKKKKRNNKETFFVVWLLVVGSL